MRILVTGALGHIGSKLIRLLPNLLPASSIVMVDNMLTQRYCSLFNLPYTGSYRFIEMDVTDSDLDSVLIGVDVVVHLAAITDAAGSFDQAEILERNNLNSTMRIAQSCAALGVRLITLSSTSVYGTQANVVDETCGDEALKPQSPYATTKLKEEKFIQKLVKEAGLQATICRFGTIFGVSPGMRFHTAVNKFCWQAALALPITVWSTAYDQKRPYLELTDACNAIAHIINCNLFDGETYNVVTLNATVREVVDAIRVQIPELEIKFVDSKIMNQLSYDVSSEKFRRTGFSTSGDMGRGIEETVRQLRMANNENFKVLSHSI